jgi:hypothetical protein
MVYDADLFITDPQLFEVFRVTGTLKQGVYAFPRRSAMLN